MVSNLSLSFMVISLLISIFLPIALVIYFYKKEKISLKVVLIGALTFIVFQMITRLPLLSVLAQLPWYMAMAENLFLLAFFLSFTAGLFEEVGRYLTMKLLMYRHLSWKDGVAFGIGHGGIESIILVGLSYINTLVISLSINSGLFDSTLAPQMGPEAAAAIKEQLISLAPSVFLAAGIERIFTIIVHIAFSLLVLYAVKTKRFIYVIYAILLHTLVNLPAVLIMGRGYNILFAELYVFVAAIIGLIYIIRSKGQIDSESNDI